MVTPQIVAQKQDGPGIMETVHLKFLMEKVLLQTEFTPTLHLDFMR